MVDRKVRGEVVLLNEEELLGYCKRPKQLASTTLQKRTNHQLD
ncbi:hypothetical protein [Rubritalea sp.]